MDGIIKAIKDAKCIGDLYQVLDALSSETVRIVCTRPLNAEQAHLMAQYLAEIRSLLISMGTEAGSAGNGWTVYAERLAALYGETEGRVKEIRNDLAAK